MDVQNIIYNNINSDIDDEDMPSLISDSDDYDIDNTDASNTTDNTDNSDNTTHNTHDTHINTHTMHSNTSQQYNYNIQYINNLHSMNNMIMNNLQNIENLNIQNIENLNNTLHSFIYNYPSADNTEYDIQTNNSHYNRIRNEINNLLTIDRNRSTRITPLLNRNDNYNVIRSEIELYNSNDYYMFYDVDDNAEHSYEYLSDLIESMGKVEIGVKDINIAAPEYCQDGILLSPNNTCVICQEDNFNWEIKMLKPLIKAH